MSASLTVYLIFLALVVAGFVLSWMRLRRRPRDAGFHVSLHDVRETYADEIHGDVVIVPRRDA